MADTQVNGQGRGRQRAAQFQEAWRQGQAPDLTTYLLPPGDPDRPRLLAELVRIDLVSRVTAGEPARVEHYLDGYPELADDPAVLLDLVLAEGEARAARGELTPLADYARRLRPYREAACRRTTGPAGLTTPPAAPPTPAPAGAEPAFPGYQVLEKLGAGGMGVVYRAWQDRLKRVVALKVIREDALAGPEARALFQREAEVVAGLQHPHIVQVYEAGEHDGRPYFTMEFVPGGGLDRRLAGRPLSPRPAAELVRTLAEVVHHAHRHGIVHRDLNPRNVLLAADGRPKVTDFGLAKLLSGPASLIRSRAIVGTPAYMAPEQAEGRNREVGPAADVYALGAILYECLTGRPPFQAASAWDVLLQVVSQEPVPPRQLNALIDRDLETVCLRCLQKDAARRYPDAGALADDLGRFLQNRPIQARPVGRAEGLPAGAPRHPPVGGRSGARGRGLRSGLGSALVLWRRAEVSRADAQHQRDRAQETDQAARVAFRRLTRLSAYQLRAVPAGFQPARKEMLQHILGYYRRFLEERAGDPALRAEVAEIHHLMGTINDATGARPEAVAEYRKAADLYRQLRAEDPANGDSRNRLIECVNDLAAACQALGQLDEAGALYGEAVDLLAGLAAEDPSYAVELAAAHNARGALFLSIGQTREAGEDYEEARRLLGRLDPRADGNPRFREERANNALSLGLLDAEEQPGGEEAEKAYRRALDILKELAAEYPESPAYRAGLATAYSNLGYLYRDREQPAPAVEANRLALEHAGPLARENPTDRFLQACWANSLLGLGSSHLAAGAPDRAEPYLEQALEVWQRLARDHGAEYENAVGLGEAQLRMGALRKAQGRADDAIESYTQAVQTLAGVLGKDRRLTVAGGLLSGAYEGRARAQARAGRIPEALRDLRDAVAAARPAARARLEQRLARDADFAPLRGQPAFAELLRAAPAAGR